MKPNTGDRCATRTIRIILERRASLSRFIKHVESSERRGADKQNTRPTRSPSSAAGSGTFRQPLPMQRPAKTVASPAWGAFAP